MLRYKNLQPEQKAHICNGCGGKGGWIKPPNFIFKASCNHHDFKFWQGSAIVDFHKANNDFYKWMKVDIEEFDVKWYMKAYYHFWAFSYFSAVSVVGFKYFHFSDKKKTLEDLQMEMIREKTT